MTTDMFAMFAMFAFLNSFIAVSHDSDATMVVVCCCCIQGLSLNQLLKARGYDDALVVGKPRDGEVQG